MTTFCRPKSHLLQYLCALTLTLGTSFLPAAVIGTNVPAEALTQQRIASLPAEQRPAWNDYLERSEGLRRADQSALQRELAQRGLSNSIAAPTGRGTRATPLQHRPAWYAGADARHIADIVISFQTPAGGWSKNLDLSKHEREAGEEFAPDNTSRFIGTNDFEALGDQRWSYVGTIDNQGTTTQLRFLAKVISASNTVPAYLQSFERGVDYLLAAQNPHGGWPQVWPLQGGYHDSITYNDGAMVNVLRLLDDIASGRDDFSFTSSAQRAQCAATVKRGVQCILDTQVIVGGKRTAWCQQHDPLTLKPTAARNYEMPSLCSAESAAITEFLMDLPNPDSNVVAAIRGAANWLEATQQRDVAFQTVGDQGRLLVAAPGKGPLWSRYYEIGTNRPIFGERDRTIHDRVDEISRERRQGYAWYTDGPQGAMQRFAKWSEAHPAP
jgi:PelA/Pel-15E family pectate lyase